MNASSSLSDFFNAAAGGATRVDRAGGGAAAATAAGPGENNLESGLCGRVCRLDDTGRLLVSSSSLMFVIRSISLFDSSSSLEDKDCCMIEGDAVTSLITAAGATGCSMANLRYIGAGATGGFVTGRCFCESSSVNKGGPKGSTD